jgi:CMP/dCMP kinase
MHNKAQKKITIAIDGPAASGKSTTAKLVAQKLGYLHIDTGAMYRALTLKVLEKELDVNDKEKIVSLARMSTIRLEGGIPSAKVYLDGTDVTDKIRTPQINRAVSTVSSYQGVRDVMVREQQRIAARGGVVLEGRDIGTVVLPTAELKFFMIASVEERVKRRRKDLALCGIEAEEEELVKEIEARDRKDSTRAISPLRKAADAIELDTSNLTIEEQVDFIVQRANTMIHQLEPSV